MRIIYTSDTHSHLFPTTFCTPDETNIGLYRIAGSFQKGPDTLVIDGGDSLQGSALSKFVFDSGLTSPFPQAEIIKTMQTDIVVPGNHDFNYGHDNLRDFFRQTGARILCANVTDTTGEIPFEKHTVITDSIGVRYGFTGIVTDYVTLFEKKENLTSFIIADARKTAEEELAWLKANSDVTILIYHGGIERDMATGGKLTDSRENIAWEISADLDYDLILSGHQHRDIPLQKLNNSWILQCPPNAKKYADIEICRDAKGLQVTGCTKGPDAAATLLEKAHADLRKQVDSWLDKPCGHLEEAIPAPTQLESALHGSHIADFFNHVELTASKADIACSSLANDLYPFQKEVTVRQIIASYQYPNTMVVLEVGEAELRAAMENAAGYFEMKDGSPVISRKFLEPKTEMYNYDYYLGVDYEFDLSKPVGQRVTKLLFEGKPIGSRKLRLVMNNYRATGTGGYDVFKTCRVLETIYSDVQDLSMDFMLKQNGLITWPKAQFKTVW